MVPHPLAGRPAPAESLVDPAHLVREYHARTVDPDDPRQRVGFGTSGHRGSPLEGTFNEPHILAITQAICEHRAASGIGGPVFVGMDTHAVSPAAQRSALEVLAANGVEVVIQAGGGFTPTPVVSRAILAHNRGRATGLADGIVITPSHNPPSDGGFKYDPPDGGPADTAITSAIERRANELLAAGIADVRRAAEPERSPGVHADDLVTPYVEALAGVLDLEAVRAAKVRVGVDPLGGSSLGYWAPIAARYGLDLTVVNDRLDPAFGFMTLDHDGRIRMDCSSPWAMAGLVGLKDRFDVAFANDPDADRHGIVTRSRGLMNPNHYLAVAIDHLFRRRPGWPAAAAVGKTLVSSALIDRVARDLGRRLVEVPVGFKWFVPGLLDGTLGFGGEESAGASFLARDGSVWTTDKDGLLLGLLAAEIMATTGEDPGRRYGRLVARLGEPHYTRVDAPADRARKEALQRLSPADVTAPTLAGDPVLERLTAAPGNGAPIGGLKVTTANGWFAARPSGTEDVVKLYAESFVGAEHLARIVEEAQALIARSAG